MILPTKHTSIEHSLLHSGSIVLRRLRAPTTVPALWQRSRDAFGSFSAFCLALDFLFCVGLIAFEPNTGLLARVAPDAHR